MCMPRPHCGDRQAYRFADVILSNALINLDQTYTIGTTYEVLSLIKTLDVKGQGHICISQTVLVPFLRLVQILD